MKTIHPRPGMAMAIVVTAFVSFCGSIPAAPLSAGEEIHILAPVLEEGDESTKPISAVQAGDVLTFRRSPRDVVDLGDCGTWYVSQATVRDPAGERPSIIDVVLTDRPVSAGTRAEALVTEIKFPCERTEGYTGPVRLITK